MSADRFLVHEAQAARAIAARQPRRTNTSVLTDGWSISGRDPRAAVHPELAARITTGGWDAGAA